MASTTDVVKRGEADWVSTDYSAIVQLGDALPNGFIYQLLQQADGQTRFLFVGAGVERLFGLTPAEVMRDPSLIYDAVHPEDYPVLRAHEESSRLTHSIFDFQFRQKTRAGQIRWMHCRSVPVTAANGETIWNGLALDITDEKNAQERSAFLIKASRILGSSLDYEATLSQVCRLAVPVLGDWCALDLLDEHGEIQRLAVAHSDPAKEDIAREFRRRYPPRSEDRGLSKVIRTGEPELVPEITDEMLVKGVPDPEQLAILRQLGLRSVLMVPLTARGRTFGAISLVTAESVRLYSEDDMDLVMQLAARAALAVDNARLFSEAQESARRREETLRQHRMMEEQLTLLLQASHKLTASLDPSAVLGAILALSRQLIAADAYAVWRDRPFKGWGIELAWGLKDDSLGEIIDAAASVLSIHDLPLMIEDVQSHAELKSRWGWYGDENIRAFLAIPLMMHGVISGSLTFYYRRPHQFPDVEVRVATALANLAGSAIQTAELYEELKENDRRKDEFLAMLAHELRNPLSAISGAGHLLKMNVGGERRDWCLQIIISQVGNLSRMIDDLLDVSRITRGKIELRKEIFDIRASIDSAIASVRALMRERNHSLTLDIAPHALYLDGDRTRVEQTIVNLLNNAAKYTEPGGKIALTARQQKDEIVVRVEDNGIGMPAELLERAFELFAQGDRSAARSEGGLGIGLTIVKSLVEMHGGHIEASSAGPGTGSSFTLHYPACENIALDAPVEKKSPERAATRGVRILVVDDNEMNALSISRLLELEGHQVAWAYDGVSALEKACDHCPDVILLDIGLPGLDGYQVVRRLRENGFDKAKIIAISGYGGDSVLARSHQSGFDHHLVKPIDYEALSVLIA